VVGQFVTVRSVASLLMLNGRRYVGMALRLTGTREQRYRSLVIGINQAVARYMLGNVVISVLATAARWLVLTILGVRVTPCRSGSWSASSTSSRWWGRRSARSSWR
jgi:predicted PurR-regulated permease PerM